MNESLPSVQQIEALHRKYAPSDTVFELVWMHCRIVADIALQLVPSSSKIDVELVQVGCLLHDIGVHSLFTAQGNEIDRAQYITHGTRGEELLRSEGFSEVLCRFASHHTGAGITKEQVMAANLPLPQVDYLANTIEEKLVMYADKFHSKTEPPYFNSYEYCAEFVTRFGNDASRRFADLTALFGKPDLTPLIIRYGHALR